MLNNLKNQLKPLAVLLILSSCNTNPTTDTLIQLANDSQEACEEKYLIAENYRMDLQEMAVDTTFTQQQRAIVLYRHAQRIDSITALAFQQLEIQKRDLLLNIGEGEHSREGMLVKPARKHILPLVGARYNLFMVRSRGTTDFMDYKSDNGLKIIKTMENYRRAIIPEVVTSQEHQVPYFFKDPEITDYTDSKDLYQRIDQAIDASHVDPDERKVLRQMYATLSLNDRMWQVALPANCSWATAFELLVRWQCKILDVRQLALSVLCERI